MCSPLRTYNMPNHHSYTQHTAFKPHILHLIHILMSLPKVQNHNASTSNNMPFRHLPKPTRDPINISQTVYKSSPLTTYNTWNNPAYRAPTPLRHHILYLKHAN